MATVYFTSTNASGDGTLYNAVKNAKVGDVISPDPTLFADGETVDIDLVGLLKIPVALTIDAGKTRLVLRRSCYNILLDNREQTGFNDLTMRGVTLIGRVLVGGNASKRLACAFERCVFGGFWNAYNLFQTSGYVDATITDCAFVGGTARGIYLYGANNFVMFTRCTIAANKKTESLATSSNSAFVDCIVDPPLEGAGFCNVPGSIDEYHETNPIPWWEWNFAPRPDSPYASGGSTCAGKTDLLGVARGWTDENGATQYAVGAFEVVKADYYLSKDTPSSASFNEPSTWKTTRGGNAAPEVVGAGVFYIDESKTFTDAPPEGASVVVAGPSRVEIGDACVLDEIRAGARSTVAFKGAVRASSFDLRDDSTVELRSEDDVALDSLTYGAGVSLKSTGRAYISAPGVDATAFKVENVVVGQRGANLSGFYADRKSPNALVFTWTPKSSSASIVIEQRVGDSWTTAATASGLITTVDGFDESFSLNYDNWRAWDGDAFFFSAPPWSKTDFFRYWNGVETTVSVSEWAITSLVANEWSTATYIARANDMGYRNENALFLALIKNPLTGKLLSPDDVENITATLYKVGGWATPNEWAAVESWTSVSVPLDSVLYTPIDPTTLTGADLAWTKEQGPNFSWAPITTENVLFAENGSYVMQVKFVLKDGKNPIVATFSAKVS